MRSDLRIRAIRNSGPFLVCRRRRQRRRYRPYFENYTVDASIFELIFDQLILMILKIISQFRVGLRSEPILDKTHVISSL
jgi:hypothetical protein